MVATYVELLMANTIRLVTDALDVAIHIDATQDDIESITERLGKLKIEMWERAKIPSEARHAFHEAATTIEKFLSLVSVQGDNGDDDNDKEADNG
jgi:hypothetical protein